MDLVICTSITTILVVILMFACQKPNNTDKDGSVKNDTTEDSPRQSTEKPTKQAPNITWQDKEHELARIQAGYPSCYAWVVVRDRSGECHAMVHFDAIHLRGKLDQKHASMRLSCGARGWNASPFPDIVIGDMELIVPVGEVEYWTERLKEIQATAVEREQSRWIGDY